MTYFKLLDPEGQVAIIVKGGIYQQTPLYTRNGYLFAKVGSGFVRLASNGSTSQASTRIDSLVFDGHLCQDALGRLCDASVSGARSIEKNAEKLLLGGPA